MLPSTGTDERITLSAQQIPDTGRHAGRHGASSTREGEDHKTGRHSIGPWKRPSHETPRHHEAPVSAEKGLIGFT
jgi:hypothetical protein